MAHNFARPTLPYQNESRPNDNRYQVLTKALGAPPTDIILDADFNFLIDCVNQLDLDIQGVVAGNIPGSDDPDNANMVVTLDGNGNLPLKLISDVNCEVDSISGNKIIPESITNDRLQDGAITGGKISPLAIISSKIADNAVRGNHIEDLAIEEDKIDTSAVTTSKLANESVTTIKLGNLSVTTAKLADLSVSTGKLINLAVTTAKLADLSVSTGKLVDLCVTTAKLADLSVTAAKIANNTITFAQISNSFAATKSQQQSASSSSVFVSPARQQDHPSACSFWCKFNGTLTGTNAPIVGYNVSSVTRISAGLYRINFTNGFSGDYIVDPKVSDRGTSSPLFASVYDQQSSNCTVSCRVNLATLIDSDFVFVHGFGALA
jgi:hypothetical protein